MTDDELRTWWPDLGLVATELRRHNHPGAADRLADAVAAGATSSEILGLVGVVLLDVRALRRELDGPGRAAWDRVMADIDRAYPPTFRFNHWLARRGGREVGWFALGLAGLLLIIIVLLGVFP